MTCQCAPFSADILSGVLRGTPCASVDAEAVVQFLENNASYVWKADSDLAMKTRLESLAGREVVDLYCDYLEHGRICKCQGPKQFRRRVEGAAGDDVCFPLGSGFETDDEDDEDIEDVYARNLESALSGGYPSRHSRSGSPESDSGPVTLRTAIYESLQEQGTLMRTPFLQRAKSAGSKCEHSHSDCTEEDEDLAICMRRSVSLPLVEGAPRSAEDYVRASKQFQPSQRVRSYGSLSGAPLRDNVVICEPESRSPSSRNAAPRSALASTLVTGVSAVIFSGAVVAVGIYSLAKVIANPRRLKYLL